MQHLLNQLCHFQNENANTPDPKPIKSVKRKYNENIGCGEDEI